MSVRAAPAIVVALAVAGCGGAMRHDGPAPTRDDAAALARPAPGWQTDFARHSVPLAQLADGGPSRDGIPPIDRPRFVSLARGDRVLAAREPVIAVAVRGRARAYPLQILVWHEIVNDRLGGVPIAVTYCPLCNSAIVFDRRVGGGTLSFGTTGKLRRSDLVMWDRQTQSWWQQFTGEALVGRYTGTRLRALDSQTLSFAQFKARYPHGQVLSRETGFDRPYGENPYVGYDTPGERPFLFDGKPDPRLPPKERVVAVFGPRETLVVPFSRLRRTAVVGTRAGATPVVVLYARGVVSALDDRRIADSHDAGTAGAFDARVARRTLSFRAVGGGRFTDAQTGSVWDITGRAVGGPLRGRTLRPLRHDEQFWFALAAFVPDARLVR